MSILRSCAISALSIAMAACASGPRADSRSRSLEARIDATLGSMKSRDPGLPGLLDSAYAYVVFPDIKKSHADLGGDQPGGELASVAAHGRGVLFEQGRVAGYVELKQAAIGGQLDDQTFAELVVFHDRDALDRLKAGRFELGANAAAIPVEPGAAAAVAANPRAEVAVFTVPQGGLVAELPIRGQELNYRPAG
jgi:lipid-binding SYLF domain-containing protein